MSFLVKTHTKGMQNVWSGETGVVSGKIVLLYCYAQAWRSAYANALLQESNFINVW